MSFQKIIYIIIGIIAAGFIIVYAYNNIKESFDKTAREEIAEDLKAIAKEARSYYHKTDDMGFSSRSFSGWYLPERYKNYGKGSVTAVIRDQKVILLGTGNDLGKNGLSKIKVEAVVTSDSAMVTILN